MKKKVTTCTCSLQIMLLMVTHAMAAIMVLVMHYHRTEFSWRPKTAKEYRKTANEMFFGGAPPSMNRQVWIARKIEFPWRLALKQCFLDCQPAKKNMDM